MSKPKNRIKIGSIVLSVWENEANVGGNVVLIPNITIMRVYVDKNKKSNFTSNFREKDIDDIVKVIEKYKEGTFDEEYSNTRENIL